jgi:hypothetical protein
VRVGAEPKKVALLALLLVLAAVLLYTNVFSEPEPAPRRTTPAPAARPVRASANNEVLPGGAAPKVRPSQRLAEFRPTLKRTNPGETLDPTRIDPTLRTDLLAKVRGVTYEGVERNLFQFGVPKPKAAPPVAPTGPPPKPEDTPAKADEPPPPPPKPTAPPVSMRYYGYVNRPGDSRRHAFLLDGEEIYVAVEGDIVKKRYRVVRIGVNSMVVEDIEFKSEQTLPLQES